MTLLMDTSGGIVAKEAAAGNITPIKPPLDRMPEWILSGLAGIVCDQLKGLRMRGR
jgi:hypothetical protein